MTAAPTTGGPAGGTVARHAFEYAVLRVMPRVDRGELMNAGVLLYCRPLDYLGSRIWLDDDRLRALDPDADPDQVRRALQAAADICGGAPEAGPPAREDLGKRFRWLTAPRSTVVQPGPVHGGTTDDPARQLEHLLDRLVR